MTASSGAAPAAAPAAEPQAGGLSVPRATALILVAACCFGSVTLLTVAATRAGAALATALVWRYALGGLLLAIVARTERQPPTGARQRWRLVVLGGAGQALIGALSLWALRFLPAGTLAFLFYTYPAWVTVLAAVRGTERLDPSRLAALALSLGGIALMVGSPARGALPLVGVLLALASALVYALYIPFIGRLQQGVTPAAAASWVAVGTTGWLIVATLAAAAILRAASLPADPWLVLSARLTTGAWLAIGGLALFSTTVAFIAFLRGLAVLGPVRTSIVSTVEPFWTAVIGWLALGQALSPRAVLGGALIGTAVLLLHWTSRSRATSDDV